MVFIGLAVIYSLVNPPFEAGDESRHYAVVKYMADTGRLITQNVPESASIQHHWSHEGNQPPLYYMLAAALTGWLNTGGWDDVFWYNPHTTIGNPLRPDNKNITIHSAAESWPWRGHVLALHIIRFLSILMATVTVVACYTIALKLFKGNRCLAAGAMAITAFNPMFIFISSAINNDNAVIMFVTLALWLMIKMVESSKPVNNEQSPPSPTPLHPRSLNQAALLGLLLGLGVLSKLYAFGLLPIAGGVFLWVAYQQQLSTSEQKPGLVPQIRRIIITALPWMVTMTFVFVLIGGWFYLRNAWLYEGDFLALKVMRETAGQREEIPSLATIRAEFEGFRIAYWGLFGGVNILAHPWIYTILDGFSLLASSGISIFIIHNLYTMYYAPPTRPYSSPISRPAFMLLLSWSLIMISGFMAWNITQPAGQGRLLYPAIAAISALIMLGLTWWLPHSGQKIMVRAVTLGLFVFAVMTPFLYIAPAYAKTPILTEADLPENIQPVDFVYDQAIRLIGYQLHADTIHPAENLPITLYWQVIQPTELNYSIFVHLLGRQRQVIGQIDSYPGGGKWPTTLLAPGDILADSYQVAIIPAAEFEHAPTRLQIAAGTYDYFEAGRPGKAAVNAAGETIDPIIAQAKLIPWQWPPIEANETDETTINFFDKATLLSYQLTEDQQNLTLKWQVNSYFETDYTVFIQALDNTTSEYITGFDGLPVQGDYPTSLWQPGEIIIDTHPLDLSLLQPGSYNLIAGLYNPLTGERLPAFNAAGPLPGYAVPLGQLHVDNEAGLKD